MKLRITEIFYSLQGESTFVGHPTVFVRLTGCPLRCQYCDTQYAFTGGQWLEVSDILAEISKYNTRYVTVTGGEPLAQQGVFQLLKQLCEIPYVVSLETSGALPVANVDERVIKIVDLKTPGSGEVARNDWNNLQYLRKTDQIKFVICDRRDYEWARDIMKQYALGERCIVLFSPTYLQLENKQLAEWILADQLNVRFQIQLHKYIWGEIPGK